MDNLIGKKVKVQVLNFWVRENHPGVMIYKGTLNAINGHMIQIIDGERDTGFRFRNIWFNTSAMSFESVESVN